MKNEIVIIPHGNQNKIIRELQNELCKITKSIPLFPLFVRFDEIEDNFFEKGKIENCKSEGIFFEENYFYLKTSILWNFENESKIIKGKIKIAQSQNEKNYFKFDSDFLQKTLFSFPVFKIAKAQFLEENDEIEWKIFEEKWIKAKKD